MNDDPSRRRLGRGLAALIGEMEQAPAEAERTVGADRQLPIAFIQPNPRNPRRSFANADLADLTQSVREHGVMQPVMVRPSRIASGQYEIIAGERRWRAAQRAGIAEIPVIVRDVDDREALELAIIENVQRADLNAIEEASGYQQLIDEHGYTQLDLANVIGKSRSHVANTLRLLRLPDPVRDLVVDGTLSAGHARTLITSTDPAGLARRIIEDGLSVRQAEALVQEPQRSDAAEQKREPEPKDSDTLALEKLLSDSLGMRVQISHKARGGDLKVSYKSLEQLDEICRKLRS